VAAIRSWSGRTAVSPQMYAHNNRSARPFMLLLTRQAARTTGAGGGAAQRAGCKRCGVGSASDYLIRDAVPKLVRDRRREPVYEVGDPLLVRERPVGEPRSQQAMERTCSNQHLKQVKRSWRSSGPLTTPDGLTPANVRRQQARERVRLVQSSLNTVPLGPPTDFQQVNGVLLRRGVGQLLALRSCW
jgi:hypothetical protein